MTTRHWPLILTIPPIIGVVLACIVTYLTPQQYESVAVIEIRDASAPIDTPTEAAKLTAQIHLQHAVDTLDATLRWGVSRQEAIEKLHRHLQIRQIRESDLIEIRARHTNRHDAMDIVTAIIEASEAHQEKLNQTEFETQRQALEIALIEQEQKVLELRHAAAGDSPHPNRDDLSDTELRHQQENDIFMQLKTQAATHSQPESINARHQILIHEFPALADAPVAPNARLNIVIGAATGLFASTLLLLCIMLFQRPARSQ